MGGREREGKDIPMKFPGKQTTTPPSQNIWFGISKISNNKFYWK